MNRKPRQLLFVLLVIGCGGCGDSGKSLHPVRGTVLKGGQPVAGGTIQFIHQEDHSIRAVSDIAGDGTFRLVTLTSSGRKEGAAAGQYKAVIVFGSHTAPVQTGDVYTVEPRENQITISLP